MLRIASFLLFFLLSPTLFALDIPPKPTGYVSDWAAILSPSAKQEFETTLKNLETSTTNQVIVATFQSLEGDALESFTIRAAQHWKVGQKDKDNGIIVFVFVVDHEIRLEVGYGLEGALPDAVAELIIQQEMVPSFRGGQFDEGIRRGLAAIIKSIAGEYAPSEAPAQGGTSVRAMSPAEGV